MVERENQMVEDGFPERHTYNGSKSYTGLRKLLVDASQQHLESHD